MLGAFPRVLLPVAPSGACRRQAPAMPRQEGGQVADQWSATNYSALSLRRKGAT